MRNALALHLVFLVALLASPVVASAQRTTDDQEPDDSPPPAPTTTSDQAERTPNAPVMAVESGLRPPIASPRNSPATAWSSSTENHSTGSTDTTRE